MRPDRDLDRELRDLAPHVEYPPTPDLARSVRDRLRAENADTGAPARTGPQLWWVAAAALVLLVALPALAVVVTTVGNSLSGGAGGGAVVEGGGGSGQQGAAGVAEPTRPSRTTGSGALSSGSSSTAACFTPEAVLEAEPARGAPGDEFRISGEHFDADPRDCDDDPIRDVRVEFLQDGRTWELGRLASDKGSRPAASLEVPAEAKPGRATVRVSYGDGSAGSPHGRGSAEAGFFVIGE